MVQLRFRNPSIVPEAARSALIAGRERIADVVGWRHVAGELRVEKLMPVLKPLQRKHGC